MLSHTMICTVCRDAGKPPSVYTSHYVKDRPGGIVVCPYLLSLVCKYCKRSGHTLSHCPQLRNNRRPSPDRPRPLRGPRKPPPAAIVITQSTAAPVKNAFEELAESSDSDSDEEIRLPEDFAWEDEDPQ